MLQRSIGRIFNRHNNILTRMFHIEGHALIGDHKYSKSENDWSDIISEPTYEWINSKLSTIMKHWNSKFPDISHSAFVLSNVACLDLFSQHVLSATKSKLPCNSHFHHQLMIQFTRLVHPPNSYELLLLTAH